MARISAMRYTGRSGNCALGEAWLIPQVIALVEREAPHVRIDVRPTTDDGAERAAQCDFAVGIVPAGRVPSRSEELGTHRLVCAARRNHPIFQSGPTPQALAACAFAVVPHSGLPPGDAADMDDGTVQSETPRFTATTIHVLPFIIEQTGLVTIVPAWFAARCSSSFRIRYVNLVEPASVVTRLFHGAATHRNEPGHRWMRDAIVRSRVSRGALARAATCIARAAMSCVANPREIVAPNRMRGVRRHET